MITVCITTMTRYDLLKKCVASARAGSVKPDRFLIYDNGGTLKLAGKDIDVFAPERNMGWTNAANFLIRNSTEHRIIVNDDIEFGEHTVRDMVAKLDEGYEYVSSCVFSCFALKDSVVKRVGWFDEELSPEFGAFADNDYSYRMKAFGVKGVQIDTGVKHVGEGTVGNWLEAPMWPVAEANYIRKWGGRPGFESLPVRKPLKTMVATPAYDWRIDVRYTYSLIETMRKFENIYPVFLAGDALIQRARNDLMKMARDADVDQIVWIDSDMMWTPEDFAAIVEDPRDFVTGMYRQKKDEVVFVVRKPDHGKGTVESCGMGFCKMSRKVIDELWEKSKPYMNEGVENRMVFEVTIGEDGLITSEDISACLKWSGEIYFNKDVQPAHIGNKVY